MTQVPTKSSLTASQAAALLWEKGVISDLVLDATQREVRDRIFSSDRRTFAVVYARQCGKSVLALTLAVEMLLKNPTWRINYIAPRLNQAKTICADAFDVIFKTCPSHLKPKFNRDSSSYIFPNGSTLRLGGCNAQEIESLRGPKAHFIIADECGFMQNLKYALRSVLYPKLNSTKGKLLLISTLPKEPGHEFMDIVRDAEFSNTLIKKNIYDCPRYTDKEIENFADEVGGKDSVDFKREYLNIVIPDEEFSVIPEFNDETMPELVVENQKPPYYDSYIGMDIGGKDMTAIVFGYYDFVKGFIYIEDEVCIPGRKTKTSTIFSNVEIKEKELWNLKKPYKRISDNNNLILLNDLNLDFGMYFEATAKDNKHAQINELRVLLDQGRVKIHPRCKTTILHLKNATWKGNRKDYSRSPDGSHFDCLDALLYLVRNVNWNKNPYPPNYLNSHIYHTTGKTSSARNDFESHLISMFSGKKR